MKLEFSQQVVERLSIIKIS
jgi:hypothetical protein